MVKRIRKNILLLCPIFASFATFVVRKSFGKSVDRSIDRLENLRSLRKFQNLAVARRIHLTNLGVAELPPALAVWH